MQDRKAFRNKQLSTWAVIFFIHVLNWSGFTSARAVSKVTWQLFHKCSPPLHLGYLFSPVEITRRRAIDGFQFHPQKWEKQWCIQPVNQFKMIEQHIRLLAPCCDLGFLQFPYSFTKCLWLVSVKISSFCSFFQMFICRGVPFWGNSFGNVPFLHFTRL